MSKKTGKNPPSDPTFSAIELTAAQTDRLTELFTDLQSKLNTVVSLAIETKANVIVLKAQQDEIVREQIIQADKFLTIETTLKQIDRKVDSVQESVDVIRQAVGGATSLAKSALDVATKLKKVSVNGR
jgi:hypothetical protein